MPEAAACVSFARLRLGRPFSPIWQPRPATRCLSQDEGVEQGALSALLVLLGFAFARRSRKRSARILVNAPSIWHLALDATIVSPRARRKDAINNTGTGRIGCAMLCALASLPPQSREFPCFVAETILTRLAQYVPSICYPGWFTRARNDSHFAVMVVEAAYRDNLPKHFVIR